MIPRDPTQFQTISQDAKLDLLIAHGKFMMKQQEPYSTRRLYRLSAYYVEVVMTPEDDSIIVMRSFKDGDHLDAYLDRISLNGIL